MGDRVVHAAIAAVFIVAAPLSALAADPVYTAVSTADAFVATGSPKNPAGADLTGLNFGGTGMLAVGGAATPKGTFATFIRFNLDGAVAQFNTAFGAGHWKLGDVALSRSSNYGSEGAQPGNLLFNPAKGGGFQVQWIPDRGWVEGTSGGMGGPGYPDGPAISYKSIRMLLMGARPVGTFRYVPPGDASYLTYDLSPDPDMMAKAAAGGDFSLYLGPTDDQVSYLFNARSFGSGSPELLVTAAPTP
jgi:hypothetical protein